MKLSRTQSLEGTSNQGSLATSQSAVEQTFGPATDGEWRFNLNGNGVALRLTHEHGYASLDLHCRDLAETKAFIKALNAEINTPARVAARRARHARGNR